VTTTDLEIKGNLTGDNTMRSKIYVPVTQAGGEDPFNRQVQEIEVEIRFSGPTLSADGSVNSYDWTMHALNWPNEGDAPLQIYPTAAGTSADNQIRFFTESNPTLNRAAGQPVDTRLSPGVSAVSTSWTDENGDTITSSFTVPANFRLDVSLMTELANAPGGGELETWAVNGHADGTMTRTVEVFDEYTDFVRTTDENGNQVIEAVRRVQGRNNVIHFSRDSLTDAGSEWSWESSIGNQGGTMTFNTLGDLVESTGTDGALDYTFTGFRSINTTASLRATERDGYIDGVLQEISFDASGRIQGHYSNDEVQILGQIAMGDVPNPYGLVSSSGSLYYTTSSSGEIRYGVAGDTTAGGADGVDPIGAGELVPGALENSNVDLSREFVTLISTQRGYQSNARIIQTSDEMLQQLVSMKR
ncbi:MAG: flagellar hook-basal body complex protein, partial [Planctomycetes bacterium]|nr:flagellar hook-basal body complex protein [Planctomycetota bacterium]